MSAKTPALSRAFDASYLYDGDTCLRLDTPAWVAWLDAATTTSFSYPLFDPGKGYIVGRMTVRKERRQRGGSYWAAYRRRDGQLRKVYLGPTAALTRARLDEVVHALSHEAGRTGYAAGEGSGREKAEGR